MKTWSSSGFRQYQPILFVDGYRVTSTKGTYQEDRYFMEFLRGFYPDENIHEKFKEWRFGHPTVGSVHKNIMRFRKPITCPHPRKWEMARQFAERHFSFMNNSMMNWDFDIAKQYVNPSKSPGFPYNRGYKGVQPFATKRDYLSYDGGKFAKQNYEEYLERLSRHDYRPTSFCVASGKKELRKVSKIKSDEFRAYVASNSDNTLAGIAAMGEMNEKFYRSWPFSSSFVGGSFYSGSWNMLFKRLNKHPHAFEMDVSAWDATLSREMIDSLCETMWSFVHLNHKTRCNLQRFRNLFREIWQTVILCPDGSLFLKNQGNPSGSFLTIVTNTIIHYMLFAYAWILLNPLGENTTYEEFDDSVSLALCGDDSLGTTEEKIYQWFNTQTIASVWSGLGVIVKPSAVSDGPLLQRQFLSQRTRMVKGMFQPYPDHEKAVSTMIWKTKAHISIKWSYLKASAMRMYTFNNQESNLCFSTYINWLENHPKYGLMLRSPPSGKDGDVLSWELVHSVYKSDREIQYLYAPQLESLQNNKGAREGLVVANELWKTEEEEGSEEWQEKECQGPNEIVL